MERLLSMDIECFSDVDLIKCGVYAYADSPAFEILLFAYSFDGGETQIIDLAQGEQLPDDVVDAIFDESVTKTAYNANFERTCLSKHFGRYLPPESWHCSAVQAAMLALPRSLEDVGRVLGLDEQKMKEGKEAGCYQGCGRFRHGEAERRQEEEGLCGVPLCPDA